MCIALGLIALSRLSSVSTTQDPFEVRQEIVPAEIDGTILYIPAVWAQFQRGVWHNGVQANGVGGWGGSIGLGPYDKLPPDGKFVISSAGKPVKNEPDNSFFNMAVTFEYPLPEEGPWWNEKPGYCDGPFDTDIVNLIYRAPEELPPPYLDLIKGLRPSDGVDVGKGWREISRPTKRGQIVMRFDANDWVKKGDSLPRRLASSSSHGGNWYHLLVLAQPRWAMRFYTEHLPLGRWQARYERAEVLFDWLRKPPAQRDAQIKFRWWDYAGQRPHSYKVCED